ncbi:protein FAR-RED IMPAIRED RESPONSE 1-like [Bidens hawaiensis]|uniref:protein FAR-RED IMPAIRED RESPONSE 1-like n=1 Tax=Bidens hawaiensis TaxID=980011 RepID=UPI004048FE6A
MNLGPIRAFNLMRTQYGGFEKRLCAKRTFSSDYSFEYDFNDEISKSNYLAFGDIITFDATFKTNNVTVGDRLLASENIESYRWLLQMLLKLFGSAPKVVVTDQDPAMKQAIASVFQNTRNRLCMWHIIKKVADKVGADLCNNEDFKSRLYNIVWTDSISPSEFEDKWQTIMVEFELDKNKWFTDMWCDHDSRYTYPQLETRSYLKREAVKIYTRSIFNDVQDEMNEIFGGVSQLSSCEEE